MTDTNETVLEPVKKKSNRGGDRDHMLERANQTRNALTKAARQLFSEQGFHHTSTNQIVKKAEVTRGALYHHFQNKEELFASVLEQLAEELTTWTSESGRKVSGDIWQRITEGFSAYLKIVASTPAIQRIVFMDGPVVLGWCHWQNLQGEYVTSRITQTLKILMAEGIMPQRPAEPLANQIQAALTAGALSIAYSDDQEKTAAEANDAFMFLLEGLKK